MVTVVDFLDNLKMVDVKSITETIISENEHEIVDLNRYDQIFVKGIDADGRSLTNYAPATQGIYDSDLPLDLFGENKSTAQTYNMFWTGDSYHAFRAYVKGDKLYITTSPRGRKLLIQNHNDSIFGLVTENQEKVNYEIIAPRLNEKIRGILF